MIYFGLAAIFISILLIAFSTYMLISLKINIGRHRWENYNKILYNQVAIEHISKQTPPRGQNTNTKSLGAINSSRIYVGLEQKLAQGNIFLHPGEFILIAFLGGLILGAILFFVTRALIMLILGLVISAILSIVYLNSCRKKKIQDFNNQIVDMLALVSNGLKAGYSFFQSIGIVAREMQPPISEEFGKMMKQISMGMSAEDALNDLTGRIDSEDLELVVTAILIQRQVGGNLSEVLDNISHTIRERIMLKNQIKVFTAQGRLSGLVISMLAPLLALVIFIMNPDFILIMITEPLGIVMIAMAILFQIIGILFIRKIVNIKL